MVDFFCDLPMMAQRTTSRTLLSPEDAITLHANQQNRQTSIAERDALLYQQLKRYSSQSTYSSSFINSIDSVPEKKLHNVHRRASAPPQMTKVRSRLSLSLRIKARQAKTPTRVDFKCLPQTVFDCILDQVWVLHFNILSPTCATCYMRDLVSLQLTCRAWNKSARNRLYEKITINGLDSPLQLKKCKMLRGSRLRLLRRTLRKREILAALIREIEVPDPNILQYLQTGEQNPDFNEYEDLIASLVMICPNLERLTGFYTLYSHDSNRLTYALSTRQKLKEHVWLIGENDEVTARSYVQLPPGLLDKYQIYQFLEYHRSWSHLETLVMCSPGRTGVIEHGLFVQTFSLLPSLKHLCISSFDADDFTDQTLLALPYLTSLRLEECPGVTDIGLARYAVIPASERLRSLSLIHQNLVDLLTISKVLTSLPQLTKFTIIQSDTTPTISSDLMIFQPLLASSSLEYLHWDVAPGDEMYEEYQPSPPSSRSGCNSTANQDQSQSWEDSKRVLSPNNHLALSIQHSGFPQLKSLRAPQDTSPPGILQGVCRPATNANVLLPGDENILRSLSRANGLNQNVSILPYGNSLQAARIRAQSYIESNAKVSLPFIQVVVTDHCNPDLSEDRPDSASSSNYSVDSAGTRITDPLDTCTPVEPRSSDSNMDFNLDWQPSLSASKNPNATKISVSIPTRSPLRRTSTPVAPLKVQEFTLPAFLGRVATTSQKHAAQPPKFKLLPDIPGRDANGGVVGWGDLLRISEKSADNPTGWIYDGCTGAWNRGITTGREPEWWMHTKRERRRDGAVVELKHFF